jgi:hypothetical protein
VQAHADHVELDDIHVVRATVVGQRHTYLVLDRLRPVFEDAAPDGGYHPEVCTDANAS